MSSDSAENAANPRRRAVRGSTDPPWAAENTNGYVAPVGMTVDAVLFTVREGELHVLLVQRAEGGQALPGGFIGERETAEQTAIRKLYEKTGLERIYLEQLATFTDPDRDPRGWIATVAYLALVPRSTDPSRDSGAKWASARRPPKLAFDHNKILKAALNRVVGKLWWSNIAAGILAEPFSIAEAREVYEAIADTTYDPSTFGRDLRATGLIRPADGTRPTRGRRAGLYEFVAHDRLVWGEGRRKRVRGG
jgi:8-oxo-dGTP diphosphatase